MKIYYQDNSWAGSITVVAESLEQAIALMQTCDQFNRQSRPYPYGIECYDITPGLILYNSGDA